MGKKFDPTSYEENFEIEEELYDDGYEGGKVKKRNKGIIIVILVILAIGLGVGGVYAKKQYDQKTMISQAEKFVELEDYSQAIDLYSQLYAKTGDEKYKSLKEQTDLKKNVATNMQKAKDAHEQGEDIEALKIYMQIPPESKKNYEEAQKNIGEIKGQLISKMKSLYDTKEYLSARKLASNFLSVYPGNTDADSIANKCTQEIDKEKKAQEAKDNKPKDVETKEVVVYRNSGNYNGLVGTYQTIVAGKANIRSGPSKGSSVIGVLSRGATVYVDDIYVESSARTWCHTSRGWVSYNTMNGNIR